MDAPRPNLPLARIGVVGAGPRGTALADALASAVPGARVVGGPAGSVPLDGVDGLVVSADAPDRAGQVLGCVAAGTPVLCDPPLGGTPEETRAIVDAEARAGRRLVQAGFARRHDPRFRDLRQQVADGAVGEVRLVHAVTVAADPDDPAVIGHELDTVAWLLGDAPRSLRLEAAGGLRIATVLTAGGVLVDLEVRGARSAEDAGDVRWEVVGDQGAAELATGAAYLAEAERIQLTAWVRSLATGVPVGASAADAYAAARVLAEAEVVGSGSGPGVAAQPGT